MDYSAWTLDQLQAEFVRLGQEYARIGTTRSEINKELEFRKKQAMARARVSTLSKPLRDALRDELTKGS